MNTEMPPPILAENLYRTQLVNSYSQSLIRYHRLVLLERLPALQDFIYFTVFIAKLSHVSCTR